MSSHPRARRAGRAAGAARRESRPADTSKRGRHPLSCRQEGLPLTLSALALALSLRGPVAYLWGWLKVLAIAFERQDYDKFKAFLKFAWQNKVSPTGATRLQRRQPLRAPPAGWFRCPVSPPVAERLTDTVG